MTPDAFLAHRSTTPSGLHNPPCVMEKLNSNVMNYMVWRYLQEAGFAMAATWLGREWHRNPDSVMPFAKYIKEYQLIHMVQDALFMDDLRVDGQRDKHKWYFGDEAGPRYPHPVRDEPEREKSARCERCAHCDRCGSATATSNSDPAKSSSRIRTKATSGAHQRVNGDSMDVDGNGYGVSDHGASETDTPAPAVQEPLQALATLSIGESKIVSTDDPLDLLPATTYLHLPDAGSLTHAEWSPNEPSALIVAGSKLARIFNVKGSSAVDGVESRFVDAPMLSDDFEVQLICWMGPGEAAMSVVNTYENDHGQELRRGRLMHLRNWGRDLRVLSSLTGAIFALRYDADSKLLLALSSGEPSAITVFKISDSHGEMIHHMTVPGQLLDAVWMKGNKFIACGDRLLQTFEITEDKIVANQPNEMPGTWLIIRYDPVCDIAVFVDEEMQLLRHYNIPNWEVITHTFSDYTISGIEFQPLPKNTFFDQEKKPRLLATCTIDGSVQIWDALRPFNCLHRLSLGEQSTAKQLSFSRDGSLLAVAGYDSLAVWNPEEGGEPKAVWKCTDQSVWRSIPTDDNLDWLHVLKWDALGKRLIFTLDNQAAVIKLA